MWERKTVVRRQLGCLSSNLADVLAASNAVRRLDRKDEPGAWRVAYALTEINESAANLMKELMPKLAKATDGASVDAALNEIGEQLRHVLYHVKDSGFFDYL